MTPKSRSCPTCGIQTPIDTGFTFDSDLNVICGSCGKVMYATKNNKDFKPKLQYQNYGLVAPTTSYSHSTTYKHHGQGHFPHENYTGGGRHSGGIKDEEGMGYGGHMGFMG